MSKVLRINPRKTSFLCFRPTTEIHDGAFNCLHIPSTCTAINFFSRKWAAEYAFSLRHIKAGAGNGRRREKLSKLPQEKVLLHNFLEIFTASVVIYSTSDDRVAVETCPL